MVRLTADEAEALANSWQTQREEQLLAPSADYYRDANSHDLIAMWRTEKNLDGRKLTKREFGCLIERWVEKSSAITRPTRAKLRRSKRHSQRLRRFHLTTPCFVSLTSSA